ncbi:MAG: phosphate signaling complex protein PhoU [Firmicutes bacterium]|nr:phosphate signaling complex protein PhoU [Bacillota bacterium]
MLAKTQRSRFNKEMDAMHQNLIKLGGLIEDAIGKSITALINQDGQLAEAVIAADREINKLANLIESEALAILLRQQPVASDLRVITTALKMVTDLERIGDQAEDICNIVLYLLGEDYQGKFVLIPKMAQLAREMVAGSIQGFIRLDTNLAQEVIKKDDQIDVLFDKVRAEMIELLQQRPQYANQAIYMMMVAKYLEKIGDHAENIADWVIFCKTGEKKNRKT